MFIAERVVDEMAHDETLDKDLWAAYLRDHGPKEREALVVRYAHTVRYAVGRMKVSLLAHVDRDDLESQGAIGLLKALDRFDPGRNVKFETFAYRWIQGSVLDYLRRLDDVGRAGRDRINKYKRAAIELRDRLGREATSEEVREFLGMSDEEMERLHWDMSVDGASSSEGLMLGREEDERDGRSDPASPEADALAVLEKEEAVARLKRGIEGLAEKERLVLSMYYQEDLTFKEIGTVLGVTESRVCQLHGHAVAALQRQMSTSGGSL